MGWYTRSNTAYNNPWIVDNHACWKAFNQIEADKCFILFTLAACSDHRVCLFFSNNVTILIPIHSDNVITIMLRVFLVVAGLIRPAN